MDNDILTSLQTFVSIDIWEDLKTNIYYTLDSTISVNIAKYALSEYCSFIFLTSNIHFVGK